MVRMFYYFHYLFFREFCVVSECVFDVGYEAMLTVLHEYLPRAIRKIQLLSPEKWRRKGERDNMIDGRI